MDGAQVGAASGANSRAPARSGERERANDCERMAQVVEAERHGGQASREWEGANASANLNLNPKLYSTPQKTRRKIHAAKHSNADPCRKRHSAALMGAQLAHAHNDYRP